MKAFLAMLLGGCLMATVAGQVTARKCLCFLLLFSCSCFFGGFLSLIPTYKMMSFHCYISCASWMPPCTCIWHPHLTVCSFCFFCPLAPCLPTSRQFFDENFYRNQVRILLVIFACHLYALSAFFPGFLSCFFPLLFLLLVDACWVPGFLHCGCLVHSIPICAKLGICGPISPTMVRTKGVSPDRVDALEARIRNVVAM